MAEINVNIPTDLRSDDSSPVNRTNAIKNKIDGASAGDVIYFPSGTYFVNGQFCNLDETKNGITLRGDGPGATIIKQINTGPAPGEYYPIVDNPFISVAGSTGTYARWFQIRDLTLHGNGFGPPQNPGDNPVPISARARTTPLIDFRNAANIRLEHVFLFWVNGPGLHGRNWWDSVCNDLQFGLCGIVSSGIGVLGVPQMLIESNGTAKSQNLVFEACRWEANQDVACLINDAMRLSFLGGKWHGALPTAQNFNAHVLLSGTYLTSFSGCHFAQSKREHLKADGASGLLMNGCVLDGQRNDYSIVLNNTTYSVIAGNFFGEPAHATNWNVTGTSTGVTITTSDNSKT